MGNNLCKENSGQGSSNKLGCFQLCPSLTGNKDHHWNKHIYETRPPVPVRQQPPPDESGWKTITLNRPVEYRSNNMDLAPIPPPRKKKNSTLSLKNVGTVKNGFKDVFGSESPRRYSVDSIHDSKRYRDRRVDKENYSRNSVSCHDVCDMATVKLPTVGNKKSDKVLGENLSDLSDGQPITPTSAKDPLDKFVEENVAIKISSNEEAPVAKADDPLCLYMNRHSDEVCYKDREPVVEELIVPRKKKTGHICDGDDFHKKFHTKKNSHDQEEGEVKEVADVIATVPRKPQRDMGIYRKSLENLNQNIEPDVPVRRKKSIKNIALPITIESPVSPVEVQPSTPTVTNEIVAKVTAPSAEQTVPISPNEDKINQGKHLKRYQSSGSFFNQDAVSKMNKRVLEFQMSEEYVMEDIAMDGNDGSQFTPGSKLDPITKKISVTAMEEPIHPVESPSKAPALAPSISTTDSVSTDGSNSSQKTVIQCAPVTTPKNIDEKKDVRGLPAEDNLFNQSSLLLAEKNVENILTSDLNMEVLSNVLNDMYDKTVLEEFQNYLETEGTDIDDELKLTGDHSDGLIKDLKLRKAVSPTPIIDVIDLADVPRVKGYLGRNSQRSSTEEDQVSIASISDDGYTNLVMNPNNPKEDVTTKTLLAVAAEPRPRRESICDVDNWFNNHIDDGPSSMLNVNNNARMMRRGSDFMVGYDTSSTFPFGRSRHDSESSEFFENRMVSKSVENLGSNFALNKGSTGSLNHKEPNSSHSSNTSLNKDHSGLLKFIVSESTNEARNKNLEDMKNDRNKQLNAVVPRIEIVVTPGEEDDSQDNKTLSSKD